MLNEKNYLKLLNYFDEKLWETKVTDGNWRYNGLILDYFFNDAQSTLKDTYLGIEDFFEANGNFSYRETESLSAQFSDIHENKRLLLIQNILHILNCSAPGTPSEMKIPVLNFLSRHGVKNELVNGGSVKLFVDDLVGEGSYAIVTRLGNGILKKRLNEEYSSDEKFVKRIKYEFENMDKLKECPQILRVYEFMEDENAYSMEECEQTLWDYKDKQVAISFEEKLKITMDVMKGMQYAHDKSIIHRDLHPGNILKKGADFVVSDFGLSKDLSIKRSLDSSCTPKNNNQFVDPFGIADFNQLDKKSDIYSIGKVIEFIFTYNDNPQYQFELVVKRCTKREKEKRYESVTEIIDDIEKIAKQENEKMEIDEVINDIKMSSYSLGVHQYVMELVKSNKISPFIVHYRLHNFGKIITQFDIEEQIEILECIKETFIDATGYCGWDNYDFFTNIAYYVCDNASNSHINDVAKIILESCAKDGRRFNAQKLLDKLVF